MFLFIVWNNSDLPKLNTFDDEQLSPIYCNALFCFNFYKSWARKKKSKFKYFSWKFSSLTFFCLEGQCELRRGSIYLLLASASHLRLSSIFRPAALSSRRLPLFAPISSKVFLTRWINAICLHVALSHIFVAK